MARVIPLLYVRRLLRQLMFAGLLLLLVVLWLRFAAHDRVERGTLTADGARVHVADGDTLRIGARTIRIQGIDAVELKQFCRDKDGTAWSCGMGARDALTALVGKGNLSCTTQAQDQYRRDIANCRVDGIADIGASLVRQGWAISEAKRSGDPYLAEEAEAKREGRGIWRGDFQNPQIWRDAHAWHPKKNEKITD